MSMSHAAMDYLESLLADIHVDSCVQVNGDCSVYAVCVEGVIRNLARLNDPDLRDLLRAVHEVLAGIREFIVSHELEAGTPSRKYM